MTKRTSRKPKRHSRKRTSRNGWGRRTSRGLKGKRRTRSKRVSRRNGLTDIERRRFVLNREFWFYAWKRSKHKHDVDAFIAKHGAAIDDDMACESRRSKLNLTENGRRRSRRNQTYYVLSPGPARNPRLSKKRRSKLPASKFVFPKDRAWPIESAKAARDAIKYIKMGRVRSAGDYMAIRSFIMKHYPAVWRQDGLSASWPKSHSAHLKGMAHRRARVGHKIAANRRR